MHYALSILIMFVFDFEVPNLSSKFKAIQTIIKLLIIYGSAPYIIDCIWTLLVLFHTVNRKTRSLTVFSILRLFFSFYPATVVVKQNMHN